MAIEVKIKKWGNSIGVILPRSFVRRKGLEENDTILIEIVRESDFSDIFGSIKKRKLSGQKFKDMVRRGWQN